MTHILTRWAAIVSLAALGASSGAFAQAPGQRSAVIPDDCDRACLIGFVRSYMDALAHKDAARVRVAPNIRFTENNVELPFGKEGLWATISAVPETGLEVADTSTGEAAWLGAVHEHGLPVYYAMRLKVFGRVITEAETVVVRTTGLPLPFGDVSKLVHDPAFEEVLTPEQRRPRERLEAVANSYFNTVELNDGMVFAPFDNECARVENGIYTTSKGSGGGGAGAFAQGCEEQFKLGIYRINKRVRERRYPLIDVERGVVVATGFFDHANEFDTYKTTDGKERKTLLKWPNSISLIEAFKIRDGRIYRIEAVFSYVPYFMHSPFYAYPAAEGATPTRSSTSSKGRVACDSACLVGHADAYMEALVRRDPKGLPWAPTVKFTENSVGLMIGEGLWGSIRAKSDKALRVADAERGTVVWYGIVSEHDAPAYYAMRLKVEDGRIAEVQSAVARARNPGPFGAPAEFKIDPAYEAELSKADRLSRSAMSSLAERYASSVELNDGTVRTRIAPGCVRVENGAAVTGGAAVPAVVSKDVATASADCAAPLALGFLKPAERVRDRRIVALDVERGVVVMSSFADFPVRETQYATKDGKVREVQDKYPSTRELVEIFKVSRRGIERIDAISVFQPYAMPSAWPEPR